MQGHKKVDNWGDHIHIFVFCTINFFGNRLFLQSANMNISIWSPPIINLFMPLNTFKRWCVIVQDLWQKKIITEQGHANEVSNGNHYDCDECKKQFPDFHHLNQDQRVWSFVQM